MGKSRVYLYRQEMSDEGTFGVLSLPSLGFSTYTCELPWRDNQTSISCIPPGKYVALPHLSNTFGRVYWLQDVPGRTYIYIHPGNVGGDEAKGFESHTEGCILLGRKRGVLWGQKAVLTSRPAVHSFLSATDEAELLICVCDKPAI